MSYASQLLPIFNPAPRQVLRSTELNLQTVSLANYDNFMQGLTGLGYTKVCESYYKGQLVGFTFNHPLRRCESMIMRDDATSPWVLFRGTKELIALAKTRSGKNVNKIFNVKRQVEEFGT